MPARLFTDIKPIKQERNANHYKQSLSMDLNAVEPGFKIEILKIKMKKLKIKNKKLKIEN